MEIKIIVACDNDWNIGKGGSLPWKHIAEDMKIFKELTTSGDRPAVVMGRKTWESLPTVHRPLCKRVNIVMSRTLNTIDDALVAKSVDEALQVAKESGISTLWVIGGEQIYYDFMGVATEVVITRIDDTFEGCDAKFPHSDLETFYSLDNEKGYTSSSYNFKLQRWTWSYGYPVKFSRAPVKAKTTTTN